MPSENLSIINRVPRVQIISDCFIAGAIVNGKQKNLDSVIGWLWDGAHNEMRPHEDTNASVVGLGKRSDANSSLLNKTVTWWCGSEDSGCRCHARTRRRRTGRADVR